MTVSRIADQLVSPQYGTRRIGIASFRTRCTSCIDRHFSTITHTAIPRPLALLRCNELSPRQCRHLANRDRGCCVGEGSPEAVGKKIPHSFSLSPMRGLTLMHPLPSVRSGWSVGVGHPGMEWDTTCEPWGNNNFGEGPRS